MGREGEERVALVLAGGVVSDPESVVSKAIVARLSQTLPAATLCRPTIEPAEAAARLAARTLQEGS